MLVKTADLETVEIFGRARLIGLKRKLKSLLKLNFKKIHLFQLETGKLIWGDECYWQLADEWEKEFRGRAIKRAKGKASPAKAKKPEAFCPIPEKAPEKAESAKKRSEKSRGAFMSQSIKEFVFPSCGKIELSLPQVFSQSPQDKWRIESGAPLFGLELFSDGALFGFAPLVSQSYSAYFTAGNGKKSFKIKIDVLPSRLDFETAQRKKTLYKNNYLQCGFGESLSEDNNKNEAFYVKALGIEKAMNIKTSAFEESVKAARDIGEKHKNLALCFSGGADSAAMLSAFLESKINFKIYIWRDKNNLIIDSDIAAGICRGRGLTCEFVEIDAIKFFESGEYIKYCANYRCLGAIELAMHIKFLENTPGTPVLSGDPPLLNPFFIFSRERGYELDSYSFRAAERYFIKRKRAGVANFFLYSAEQFGAFANRQKQLSASDDEYYRKCELYRISDFPFNAHFAKKYFGNEKIREHYEKKTGDFHFFDKKFRYKALLAQKEREPFSGGTVEPNGLIYFPENLTTDCLSQDIQGFKHCLRD